MLELVERGHRGWSVERVFRLLLTGKPRQGLQELRELTHLAALSGNWKKRALKLLEQ